MNKKTRISLFIITKNEEKHIARCIMSARNVVSEIVVVDSSSKDKTVEICRELGAQVFTRSFDGFTNQKNYALSKITSEWALSLDADETLSPELAEEIKKAVAADEYNGYELVRVNNFLGKRMYHSGIKNERLLRLVRKEKAKFKGGLVHEKLTVEGKIGRLKNVFTHHPYENIESYFEKFNRYTTLAARTMHNDGKHTSVCLLVLRMPFEFAKRYILQLGFLDGVRGLIWSANSAFYVFTKYMKLWYLEQTNGRKTK